MTETPSPQKTRNNWLLYGPLMLLTGICVVAGALLAYAIVTQLFGYSGGKSGVFYIGGAFGGYMFTVPLWSLYRKFYPKAESDAGQAAQ
ncbi:hypothetical protein [Erythrobacter sp. EC-HK427]|uniref:hypothetical protein n=1 Tax=Erythrobacter sp. EC-HK427 TaxID=2038396 RepID=UPI0012579410|nr:hypothetical protein [Erythrobacter sp. EC-HK427]VVT05423.1 conserved hypothetical protein [Erythrobacter sp. EC-HK427]